MFTVKDLKEKIANLEDEMPVCFLDFDDDAIEYMKLGQVSVEDIYIYKMTGGKVFSLYEDAFEVESEVQKVFCFTQG